MTDLSFTPTFQHTNWIDNVDRIQAGGPNGFNVRFDAIDSDLRQASAVVQQINAALALPGGGPPTGTQLLTPGLGLVSVPGFSGGNGWFYDATGAAHPAGGTGGDGAVMDLTLPDQARLLSFRAVGLYAGSPVTLNISLLRESLASTSRTPDLLATITNSTAGFTNPYDVTVPVNAEFAAVDTGTFRYYILASATLVSTDGSANTTLATVQLAYSAG